MNFLKSLPWKRIAAIGAGLMGMYQANPPHTAKDWLMPIGGVIAGWAIPDKHLQAKPGMFPQS
jgi:hypothetical protein